MFEGFTGLVKFSAEWCGPCKAFAPVVKKVSEENNIELRDVDIDEQHEVATQFNIRAVPAMVSMVDGEPTDVLVGAHNEESVKSFCSRNKLM